MLKNGILIIFKANIIALIFNIITNFCLPKYLSIEGFALIKTFQLYISYIGLFHFGYCDGMYLRYGGQKKEIISKQELKNDMATMRVYQIFIVAVSMVSLFWITDVAWIGFLISMVPLNMVSYYKLLCQATGEFTHYGRIVNITTFLTFFANIILVFVFRVRENTILYIFIYLIIDIGIWLGLESNIQYLFELDQIQAKFDFSLIKKNVKDGILLTLGNLSTTLFTSMDRWFVKALMDVVSFAQYSFAVSTEAFLNVAITPVSVTLYNFFCNHKEKSQIISIRNKVLIFASWITATFFPVKWILEHYLKNYIDAVDILIYLFAAQSYNIVIKCIYINLYKTSRLQKKYFFKLVIALIIGFCFNIILFGIMGEKEAFALGTLCSSIFWLLLIMNDFKSIKLSWKEWVFLIFETIFLYFCGNNFNAIVGCIVFVLSSLIITILFMRKEFFEIIKLGQKII